MRCTSRELPRFALLRTFSFENYARRFACLFVEAGWLQHTDLRTLLVRTSIAICGCETVNVSG